jgi:hypothetical protein
MESKKGVHYPKIWIRFSFPETIILLLWFPTFISNNLLVQKITRHIGTMLASYFTEIKVMTLDTIPKLQSFIKRIDKL